MVIEGYRFPFSAELALTLNQSIPTSGDHPYTS
jgi:hypothetical protein